jgi:hypothetical protein
MSRRRKRTRKFSPSVSRAWRRRAECRLTTEYLEPRLPLTAIALLEPAANSHNADPSTVITATFDQDLDPATVSDQTFFAHATQSGPLSGDAAIAAAGTAAHLNPASDLFPGELVNLTATSGIQSTSGEPAQPRVWQFRAAVAGSSGEFATDGQSLGDHASRTVALGDLDGDGDLDAFVANSLDDNRVWLNDDGTFTSTNLPLISNSWGVELGDLDGDGDLDAFVANRDYDPNGIWLNDGDGGFTDSGQALGDHDSRGISLGDLDGDGDLDAFVVNAISGSRLWLNDGSGAFNDSGQVLGNHYSYGVTLGDLDNDGDLDAFVANLYQANHTWMNFDGVFTNSGQSLGTHSSDLGALGDLDGDGDLDAIVGNFAEGNRVWTNDGSGSFNDSGQSLGDQGTEWVSLGDVDGDGDLDAVTANYSYAISEGNRVWLNDDGVFSDSRQVLGDQLTTEVALGDLDGDGDLDIFAANVGANRIWLNQTPDRLVTLTVDNETIAEADGSAVFTAVLSEVTTLPVTVDLEISGTATELDDYTITATQIVIPVGSTTGSVTVSSVNDTLDESAETVVVDIGQVMNASESGAQQQTTTITDDDEPVGLVVNSLAATPSGFMAEFSDDLDTTALNLYDTRNGGLGPADVVLQGALTGSVAGSLIIDPSLRAVEFVKSGGALPADTYTVTLRSGVDAFKDASGMLLDGDRDGTPGGSFSDTFTISEPAANVVTISISDFVRGPGQEINLPADTTQGIPVTITGPAAMRSVSFSVDYDPARLIITAATAGLAMPAGVLTLDTSTVGTAVVTFSSPSDLPAGENVLVNLQAAAPSENASAVYRSHQVIDIHSISVTDSNSNSLPVQDGDAVYVAAYFGDVSGNGRINAGDATLVARIVALLDGGLAVFPLVDSAIASDISGNGRLNSGDAALVARFAALLSVPQIPPVPGGIVITGAGAPGGIPGNAALQLPSTASAALHIGGSQTGEEYEDDREEPPVGRSSSNEGFAMDAVRAERNDHVAERDEQDEYSVWRSAVDELLGGLWDG